MGGRVLDATSTAASLVVSAVANVKTVQRMLGNVSAAMTLDVHAGMFDDDLAGVADRLDGIIADRVRTDGTLARLADRRAAPRPAPFG
jgi:hypothetical protein